MNDRSNSNAAKVAGLSERKATLLRLLLEEKSRLTGSIQRYARGEGEAASLLPTSLAQQRLWFIDELENGAAGYRIAVSLRLCGELNPQTLQYALNELVHRHEILRAVFVSENGTPRQRILDDAHLPLAIIDLSNLDETECSEQLRRNKTAEAHNRFDIKSGPLIRARLVKVRSEEHVLLLTLHHIITDEWSTGVILREITELYSASSEGRPSSLEPLRVQYADYAQWQLDWLKGRNLDSQLNYWRARLEGSAPQLELPTDRPRPSVQSYHGQNVPVLLDARLTARLRGFAQRNEATLFMVLYAAWAILLSRLSGQEDIVVGMPIANRQRPELEGLIGFFVNTLVLRSSVQSDLTVQQFVQQTKSVIVGAYDHQDLPFDRLVEALQPVRSLNRNPLFQVAIALQNVPKPVLRMPALTIQVEDGAEEPAIFDLLLLLEEQGNSIGGTLNYAADLFDRQTIERWLSSFKVLLEGLTDVSARLGELPIMSPQERRQVLHEFNDTHTDYPQHKLVHELFEEEVDRAPNSIAVVDMQRSVTYAELNASANQLAHHLLRAGAQPGEFIPIVMPRCLQMLVSHLAVIKCGCGYLPIDPALPLERQAFMIRDCGARRVLAEGPRQAGLELGSALWIDCKDEAPSIDSLPITNPGLRFEVPPPAYVMYTSGSTGEPKGVEVPHHAIVRLVINNGYARILPQDCIAHYSNCAFDASTFEIWGALLSGARVLVVPQALVLEGRAFAEALLEHRVTVLWMTVGLFAQFTEVLAEVFGRLRYLIVGGDVVDPQVVAKVMRNCRPQCFLSAYGPTECTTFSTTYRVEAIPADSVRIPIGRPIANAQVYVLDSKLAPVPIGVTGEIYIGGAGLATGYLNRPELTEARFVADPFSAEPGARLYKTGDVGRWRADGNIEFQGRNDQQVKLRGFRVELGEIEARLLQNSTISEAAVVVRQDVPGDKRLVAYVKLVEGKSLHPEELRRYLGVRLPEYMLPSAFVQLDCFPLTPNGKLDRRAFPVPGSDAYASRQYERPRGEMEEIVATIWEDILQVERVGRRDNFFELGGHSLLIVKMLDRLRQIGLSAAVRRVFESPTVADLALTLSRGLASEIEVPPNSIPEQAEVITPEMLPLVDLPQEAIDRIVESVPGGTGNVQDIYPLAPLQEGILFHHLLDGQSGDTYVVSTLLAVSSRARLQDLIAALQAAIDRHDVLRTAILWEQLPRPVQVVYRRAALPVTEVLLRGDSDPAMQVKDWLHPDRQKLDLRQAPLIRLQVAENPATSECYALLQMHHTVCDHVTAEIVVGEIVSSLENREVTTAASVPYRNHVAHALAYESAHDSESFFREKLGDIDEPTAPFGLLDVHAHSGRIEEAEKLLEISLSRRVRAQARRLGVTVASLFHAAWALVVARTSSRHDVVFGTVLLGRLQGSVGAGPTLGMFINTLPLRLKLQGMTPRGLLEQVQREIIDLLQYEQASLAVAQRCTSIASATPLFNTLFNFRHSTPDAHGDWAGATGIRMLAMQDRTNYPITFSVDDLTDAFRLTAQTDRGIDPHRIVDYMSTSMRSLVDALEADSQQPALALEILTAEELERTLRTFNETKATYDQEKLVHQLFEEQLTRTPDAVAVVHGEAQLTYSELNAAANGLARRLLDMGVRPDQVVGICMPRGLQMVIGLLGVLKSGAAYLPLDPNYPSDRLKHMLVDAAPAVVLTLPEIAAALPKTHACIIALTAQVRESAQDDSSNPDTTDIGLASSNLVYVIYTSGSTGLPKATAMSHRSMVNLLEWHRHCLGFGPGKRVLQFAALSFDVAFQEIFTTLCTGSTLIMLDECTRTDLRELSNLLKSLSIQRLFLPPLMLQSVAEYCLSNDIALHSLEDVIAAGEQLRINDAIKEFFENTTGCRLHNHYGPTESHVVTALALSGEPAKWPSLPSIGRPIFNTQIYVLDEHRRPVPVGVPGELYIGGAGVARGYLGRPELTNTRFVADPFSGDAQSRMYRTGDLGRWRADGLLEFLGRNDHQVKIRGYRVELGEIEAQLSRHEKVKAVAVVSNSREDSPGERRLVAYVVCAQVDASDEELRSHLRKSLPDYMVPSAFVRIDRLPTTPNGKLDRRALPAPEAGGPVGTHGELPQGEVETVLAAIWQKLLRVERVGRDDNFFELGGHSLHVMKFNVEIAQCFTASVSISTIFQNPTIRQLARIVNEAELEEGVI